MALDETESTALWPAIVSAIALAGEGAPSSIVIFWTDGLANDGLRLSMEYSQKGRKRKFKNFMKASEKMLIDRNYWEYYLNHWRRMQYRDFE